METLECQVAPRSRPFLIPFNSETAREAGKKSGEARRKKRDERLNPAPPPALPSIPTHEFLIEQRDAARAEMKRIAELRSATTVAKEIRDYSAAWAIVADEERKWDGRPLPGGAANPDPRNPNAPRSPRRNDENELRGLEEARWHERLPTVDWCAVQLVQLDTPNGRVARLARPAQGHEGIFTFAPWCKSG